MERTTVNELPTACTLLESREGNLMTPGTRRPDAGRAKVTLPACAVLTIRGTCTEFTEADNEGCAILMVVEPMTGAATLETVRLLKGAPA